MGVSECYFFRDGAKAKVGTVQHPNPYQLCWLQKGNEIKVSKRCLVSIGKCYKNDVWCDVALMDACPLLGRPWHYDRKVIYDGYNTLILS